MTSIKHPICLNLSAAVALVLMLAACSLPYYGYTVEETQLWKQYNFAEPEAVEWRNYTPEEAAAWRDLAANVGGYRLPDNPTTASRSNTAQKQTAYVSNWRYTGFSVEDATLWARAGWNANAAKSWRDAGWTDPDEAAEWKGADPSNAIKWRNAGFDLHSATDWSKVGFDASAAEKWRAAGFDADTARTWKPTAKDGDPVSVQAWRDAGFSPGDAAAWSKDYTLAEAQRWQAKIDAACPGEMNYDSNLVDISPYQAVGQCFAIDAEAFQNLGPNAALYQARSVRNGPTFRLSTGKRVAPKYFNGYAKAKSTFTYTTALGAQRTVVDFEAIFEWGQK